MSPKKQWQIFDLRDLPDLIGADWWRTNPETQPDKVREFNWDIAARVDALFWESKIIWYADYENVSDDQILEVLITILNKFWVQKRQKHIWLNAWFSPVEKITIERLHKYLETPEWRYRLQKILLNVFFSQRGIALVEIQREKQDKLIELLQLEYWDCMVLIMSITGDSWIDSSDLDNLQAERYLKILQSIMNSDV